MNSFRNGETPTEAYIRIKNEMRQDLINNQKEKEMEERIFNKVMNKIHITISNETKKSIKEINKLINELRKGGK